MGSTMLEDRLEQQIQVVFFCSMLPPQQYCPYLTRTLFTKV